MQPALPSGRMFDMSNARPCMYVVSQPSRCLLEQETQTNPLWVPQQGLVFVRSHAVIYGGSGFDIIYVHT